MAEWVRIEWSAFTGRYHRPARISTTDGRVTVGTQRKQTEGETGSGDEENLQKVRSRTYVQNVHTHGVAGYCNARAGFELWLCTTVAVSGREDDHDHRSFTPLDWFSSSSGEKVHMVIILGSRGTRTEEEID